MFVFVCFLVLFFCFCFYKQWRYIAKLFSWHSSYPGYLFQFLLKQVNNQGFNPSWIHDRHHFISRQFQHPFLQLNKNKGNIYRTKLYQWTEMKLDKSLFNWKWLLVYSKWPINSPNKSQCSQTCELLPSVSQNFFAVYLRRMNFLLYNALLMFTHFVTAVLLH